MKWGDLLAQLCDASPNVQERGVRETFLPFVEKLKAEHKELTLDDCKGIIGVILQASLQDRITHTGRLRRLIEQVISSTCAHTQASENICKVATHALNRDMFNPRSLGSNSRQTVLRYVSHLSKCIVDNLPAASSHPLKDDNVDDLRNTSSQSTPTTFTGILKYLIAVVHSTASGCGKPRTEHTISDDILQAQCKPLLSCLTKQPRLLEYFIATLLDSDSGLDGFHRLAATSLVLPLLSTKPNCHRALLEVVATAIAQSGTGQQPARVWSNLTDRMLQSITPQALCSTLLPPLVVGLGKANATYQPVLNSIVTRVPSCCLTADVFKQVLSSVVKALKDPTSAPYAANVLNSFAKRSEDPEVLPGGVSGLTEGLHGADAAAKPELLKAVGALLKVFSRECPEAPSHQKKMEGLSSCVTELVNSLKTALGTSPVDTRCAILHVVGLAGRVCGVVPDWVAASLRDLAKAEDETLRRSALVALCRLAFLPDTKRFDSMIPVLKQILSSSETKTSSRADAVMAIYPLIRIGGKVQKGDGWFKNGILGEGYLMCADNLSKLLQNEEYLHCVLDAITIMIPPDNALPKETLSCEKEGTNILDTLMLLGASNFYLVRNRSHYIIRKLVNAQPDLAQHIWTSFRRCFVDPPELSEQANTAAAPAVEKPTTPSAAKQTVQPKAAAAKVGLGAKPKPKGKPGGGTKVKVAAPSTPTTAGTSGSGTSTDETERVNEPIVTTSTPQVFKLLPSEILELRHHNIQHLFVHVALVLSTRVTGDAMLSLLLEIVLVSHHPKISVDAPHYWLAGIHPGVYDDAPSNRAFNRVFGTVDRHTSPPSPITKETSIAWTSSTATTETDTLGTAVDGCRDLLKAHFRRIIRGLLSFVASKHLPLHIAACRALASVISVIGTEALQVALTKAGDNEVVITPFLGTTPGGGGIQSTGTKGFGDIPKLGGTTPPTSLLDLGKTADAVRDLSPHEAAIANSTMVQLQRRIQKEIDNELRHFQGGTVSVNQKADDKWEQEMRAKKLAAAGQDAYSKKSMEMQEQLEQQYGEIHQKCAVATYSAMCTLQAIKHIARRPDNKATVHADLPCLMKLVLPFIASEVQEVIRMGRNVLKYLILASDLAALAGPLSDITTSFGAFGKDPSCPADDSLSDFVAIIMPKLRLAAQGRTLSASTFSIMFPVIQSVLTNKAVLPKFVAPIQQSEQTLAEDNPQEEATQPIAEPVAPVVMPTMVLAGKGGDVFSKGGKGKGGGKGGKGKKVDAKDLEFQLKMSMAKVAVPPGAPLAAAAAATTTVAKRKPKKDNKPEYARINVPFSTVSQSMALTLLHNHVGLPDLPNRLQVATVLLHVLTCIPSLFRSTVQALSIIGEHLSEQDLPPIIEGLQSSNPMHREAMLGALKNYPYFQRYSESHEVEPEEGEKTQTEEETTSEPSQIHKDLALLLYITRHDESDVARADADKLFNNAGVTLQASYASRVIPYVFHKEEGIRKAASTALNELFGKFPDVRGDVLQQGYEHFASLLKSTETEGEERTGAAYMLLECNPSLNEELVVAAFNFCTEYALTDFRDDVKNEIVKSGRCIINQHGKCSHVAILNSLKKSIDKVPSSLDEDGKDYYTASIVVWMGACAGFASDEPQILGIVDRLLTCLDIPSLAVQKSIAGSLAAMVQVGCVKTNVEKYLKICTQKLFKSGNTFVVKKGAAFGIAGIISGMGLPTLWKTNVLQAVKDAASKKNDAQAREGALIALEILADVLGPLFEPYTIEFVSWMLNGFADKNENIRQAADDAAKIFMKGLTEHGVRQVLPRVLQVLDDSNWRSKVSAIEMLGAMAYCSRKQLAACMPQIVPKLVECLTDSHDNVSSAAEYAIKRVGGVITNPEIAGHVTVLLRALADPTAETDNALEALLFTRFVHTVDAPALALVFPILLRGLRERATATKMKAAQITGSLSQLIADALILVPYVPRLLPQLKQTLVDPIPEVRSTAAKALGSLVKGLGEHRFPGLLDWLMETIRTESSQVERAGSAQGLCEVLTALGVARVDSVLPEVLAGTLHPKPHVKSGYLHVFVYLPHCMGASFQVYLPKVLPRILSGLADDSDQVRQVALRAGQMVVQNYGSSSLTLLLPALQNGCSSESWRIRHSSLILLGDLLMRVATQNLKTIKPKVTNPQDEDEEEEDEEEEEEEQNPDMLGEAQLPNLRAMKRNRADKSTNSCVEALFSHVGEVPITKTLSTLYMMKFDDIQPVRIESNNVWRSLIDNTPALLRKIMDGLVAALVKELAGADHDRRMIAGRALGDLVAKLGDFVVPHLLPQLQEGLASRDADRRHGVCLGLTELLLACPKNLLLTHSSTLISAITAAAGDDNQLVRDTAGQAFDQLFKALGPRCTEDTLSTLIKQLKSNDPEEAARAVNGIAQVVSVRPKVVLPLVVPVFKDCKSLNKVQCDALTRLASAAGLHLFNFVSTLLPVVIATMGLDDLDEPHFEKAKAAAKAVILDIDEDSYYVISQAVVNAIQDSLHTKRKGGAIMVQCMCEVIQMNTPAIAEGETAIEFDWYEHCPSIVQYVIRCYGDKVESVQLQGIQALNDLTALVTSQRRLEFFDTLHSSIVSISHSVVGARPDIPALHIKGAADKLLEWYIDSLLFNSEQREHAARALAELVELLPLGDISKPYLTKICGRLIRVVAEKQPARTKQEITAALSTVIFKGGTYLNTFTAPMITTFIKGMTTDPDAGCHAEEIKGLSILLTKHEPRVTGLVTELTNALKAQTDPVVIAPLLRATALTVVKKSKHINADMATKLYVQVVPYIDSDTPKVRAAACKAMGLLENQYPDGDVVETMETAIQQCNSKDEGENIAGLSTLIGLLQSPATQLKAEQASHIVQSVLPHTTSHTSDVCLYATRVIHRAITSFGKTLAGTVLNKCLKALFNIINDNSTFGSPVERRALLVIAEMAALVPEVFGKGAAEVVGCVLNKVQSGNSGYNLLVMKCVRAINENVESSSFSGNQKSALQKQCESHHMCDEAIYDSEVEDQEAEYE